MKLKQRACDIQQVKSLKIEKNYKKLISARIGWETLNWMRDVVFPLQRSLPAWIRTTTTTTTTTTIFFIGYYRIFYRHIVKRLRPLFAGGAIQIPIDWLISWFICIYICKICVTLDAAWRRYCLRDIILCTFTEIDRTIINDLPSTLPQSSLSALTFKQRLKLHLFRLSYPGLIF